MRKNILQAKKIGRLLRTLGQPARLRILTTIGKGEACVCHLEAALGYRQAYISQHLMALRKAKLVTSRRDGRNIYYRIANPGVLDLVQEAGGLVGLSNDEMRIAEGGAMVSGCPCPHCNLEQSNISPAKIEYGSTMAS